MLAILCHSCHYYNHSSPLSLGNQSCQDDRALGSVPVSSGGWSLVSSLVSASDQYQRPGARAGLRLRHRGQTEDINPAPSNTPSLQLQTSIPPAAKTIKSTHKVWAPWRTGTQRLNCVWVYLLIISFN